MERDCLPHPPAHLWHWAVEAHPTSAYFLPLLVESGTAGPEVDTADIRLKFGKMNPTHTYFSACVDLELQVLLSSWAS